jgi:threonine synthase
MTKNFVTHLECSITGETDYTAGVVHGLSRAGRPLLTRYDLEAMKRDIDRDAIWARPGGFWKWRELLPVVKSENIVSLGEQTTPLLETPNAAARFGHSGSLLVKDEGRLPTASFKARGLGLAVSMAKELGLTRLAMPTNGNAGAALAAYATRAGLDSYIFCPEDTPVVNVNEMAVQGGKVWRVNGYIDDCGKLVGAGTETMGWFDLSTLKEPYRLEGKKTMAFELAAQLNWKLPDAIFFPTGGGTVLAAMWKAFNEMEALGWIGPKRPKMIAVQAAGCAPLVRAFEAGERHAKRWENAHTMAAGIRVPQAVGDFMVLDAVRSSNGKAIAVSEEAIIDAVSEVGRADGLMVCPEAAAGFVALQHGVKDGWIAPDDQVVIINSGNGLKYRMPEVTRALDINQVIDFSKLS